MENHHLQLQIIDTIHKYVASLPQPVDEQIVPAMISGMSLVADFLAKNDGHPKVTAQFVASAIAKVGKELGLSCEKLNQNDL